MYVMNDMERVGFVLFFVAGVQTSSRSEIFLGDRTPSFVRM